MGPSRPVADGSQEPLPPTQLTDLFDTIIQAGKMHELVPPDRTPLWDTGERPETYTKSLCVALESGLLTRRGMLIEEEDSTCI
jgi:hypothetical protein